MPQILLGLGVHFVYVPHLPSTYVDGATFMLDGTRPVIAMSLRRNRIDNFWMTLLHELGHVLLGHTEPHLDSIDLPDEPPATAEEGSATAETISDDERAADRWVVAHLIDLAAYERFRDRPRDAEISMFEVKEFARQQGRTPGIVMGLLWKDRAIDYGRHRQLLGTKVREDLESWRDLPGPPDS